MRTWHLEMAFVGIALAVCAYFTGGWIAWIAAAAGLCTFGHCCVANRMEERERYHPKPIDCLKWLQRYWASKEVLWIAFFISTKTWPAIVTSVLMLTYPLWRKTYRKHYLINR